MATSLVSDFKVYDNQFQSGMYEALAENTQIFNAASRGGIILSTNRQSGDYKKEAFFKQISSLVTRQDLTSVSAATKLKLEQGELIGVKLSKKVGPVDMTLNAFKKAGLQTPDGSYRLGRLAADAMAKSMADAAIISLNCAVGSVAALVNDITGASVKTANLLSLIDARGKWGDTMGQIAAWISHSKNYIDLIKDGLENYKMDSVAGVMFSTGQANAAAGAPFVIADNSNLVTSGSPNTYAVLGIKPGACMVEESEDQTFVLDVVSGNEQIIVRLQGEFAITVSINGFAWDTSTGSANPTDATLGTDGNWDAVYTDTTALPIVKLNCQ